MVTTILTGGMGADLFQCGAGNDKITDFNPSEGDKKANDCEHSEDLLTHP